VRAGSISDIKYYLNKNVVDFMPNASLPDLMDLTARYECLQHSDIKDRLLEYGVRPIDIPTRKSARFNLLQDLDRVQQRAQPLAASWRETWSGAGTTVMAAKSGTRAKS
jgi:hypothetical protein